MAHPTRLLLRAIAIVAFVLGAHAAFAQGVTTGSITGVVKDAQGAVVPGVTIVAVHQPSGTTYEAVTQADGRFFLPGMRVGGWHGDREARFTTEYSTT